MKKMKLASPEFDGVQLTRDQLKVIFGGGSSEGQSKCHSLCSSDSDCGGVCPHCGSIPNWTGSKACYRS